MRQPYKTIIQQGTTDLSNWHRTFPGLLNPETKSHKDAVNNLVFTVGNSDDKSIAALLVKLLMEKEKGSGHIHGR